MEKRTVIIEEIDGELVLTVLKPGYNIIDYTIYGGAVVMQEEPINPQWHIDVTRLTDSHLRNRIAWSKRQIIDTWEIHGDEPKYGAGGGMDKMINAENEEIEKHIEAIKEELKRRSV